MLILSPFLGAVQFYIQAWLLRFTGKWIKGKASTSDLKLVCAWSFAPVVFVIFPSLFLVMIFPKIFFHLELYPIITLILSLGLMVTWFWSFILLIAGIAKVQNFSIARALVNAFLPLLAFIGLVILVGISVSYVS
ncbi:MAG: YIP1 family protein [Chlamydiae bacterium]|nr:YIP1 family protein [Chlamydiota bacterium]